MANTKHDYFPSDEASNISNEFEVDNSTAVIQVKDMPERSCLYVEYYFGDECDGCWQPFNLECCQLKLCGCQNTFFFPFPGKFRLVAIDEDQNYLTDPSFFEGMQIQIRKIEDDNKSFNQYYTSCDISQEIVSEEPSVPVESYTDQVLKLLLESDLFCNLLENRLTNQ